VVNNLHAIRSIINFPPLKADGTTQTEAFNPETGLLCLDPINVPTMTVAEAKTLLLNLQRDVLFPTEADRSRYIAGFLTPLIRLGVWPLEKIAFPIHIYEAEESQSGKGLAVELIGNLFGGVQAVSQPSGGVGSFEEKIQSAMIGGHSILNLDNLKGRIDSCFIESFVTANGPVQLRVPHRVGMTDSRAHVLLCTSNGLQMTEDLGNRSLTARIRKQPAGYKWHNWPKGGENGDIRDHVRAMRAQYLGAVYALVREWIKEGTPTTETTHSFRRSVGALNWIVTKLLGLPDLMTGQSEIKARQASPIHRFLKEFAQTVDPAAGSKFSALGLVTRAESYAVTLPESVEKRIGETEQAKQMGILLGQAFKASGGKPLVLDGWKVIRTGELTQAGHQSKQYQFQRSEAEQSTFSF
jgi:hypothetical protein